jgi:hypothetical protein
VKTPLTAPQKIDTLARTQAIMHPIHNIRRTAQDPLATFRIFEIMIAVVCIAMPGLLWLADNPLAKPLICISEYAYMPMSYFYGMLLTVPAMLFIFNGAVYFRNEANLNLSKAGKWYNIILGVSLLGVILTPYHQYFWPHLILASIFFGGNAVVIAVFHQPKYRTVSIILALLTVVTLALNQIFNEISLFWAEWASLAVIGIHFILEAAGVVQVT